MLLLLKCVVARYYCCGRYQAIIIIACYRGLLLLLTLPLLLSFREVLQQLISAAQIVVLFAAVFLAEKVFQDDGLHEWDFRKG